MDLVILCNWEILNKNYVLNINIILIFYWNFKKMVVKIMEKGIKL